MRFAVRHSVHEKKRIAIEHFLLHATARVRTVLCCNLARLVLLGYSNQAIVTFFV